MACATIKKDTQVTVIAGAHRGKTGKVLSVDPEKNRVLIEGVNRGKKAMRRSQKHPQGGLVEQERPLHISNVMVQERYEARKSKRAGAQSNGGKN